MIILIMCRYSGLSPNIFWAISGTRVIPSTWQKHLPVAMINTLPSWSPINRTSRKEPSPWSFLYNSFYQVCFFFEDFCQTKSTTTLFSAGHTHAGQIFPFSIPVYLANAFYSGLYQFNSESYVYVTQGTYYYGWPLRTASHNEITKITLKSS